MPPESWTFDEHRSGLGLDAAMEEAWRCLQCEDPPCEKGCAARVPVRKFIRKIRNLDFRGAALVIRQANVREYGTTIITIEPCHFVLIAIVPTTS